MKRILFYTALLAFLFTSCYPPQIIYSIEYIKPSYQEDSIRIHLIEGNTISTGTTITHLGLYLEISNDREDDIFTGQNSLLELRTDSAYLQYKILQDSLIYRLDKNDKQLLRLSFQATDFDHITYKTVNWPSIWSFRTLKEENPRHRLFLFLDLRDENENKIEKCIILKPTGTRRM
jgi:hypothetical protein